MELDINRLEYHGLDKELKGITMYCALRVLTTSLHHEAAGGVVKGSLRSKTNQPNGEILLFLNSNYFVQKCCPIAGGNIPHRINDNDGC